MEFFPYCYFYQIKLIYARYPALKEVRHPQGSCSSVITHRIYLNKPVFSCPFEGQLFVLIRLMIPLLSSLEYSTCMYLQFLFSIITTQQQKRELQSGTCVKLRKQKKKSKKSQTENWECYCYQDLQEAEILESSSVIRCKNRIEWDDESSEKKTQKSKFIPLLYAEYM